VKGKLTAPVKKAFVSLFETSSINDVKNIRLIFDDSFSTDRSGISLL